MMADPLAELKAAHEMYQLSAFNALIKAKSAEKDWLNRQLDAKTYLSPMLMVVQEMYDMVKDQYQVPVISHDGVIMTWWETSKDCVHHKDLFPQDLLYFCL